MSIRRPVLERRADGAGKARRLPPLGSFALLTGSCEVADSGAQVLEKAQSLTELHPHEAAGDVGEFRMTHAEREETARAAAARAARESYGKLLAYLAAPRRDVPGA